MDNNTNQQTQSTFSSLIDKIYGERNDLLQKLLTIISVIFFILVPVALIYNIVYGIVYLDSIHNYSGTLSSLSLLTYFAKAITSSLVYAFYGLILAVLKRIISK
jgi:hypothetical protein